MGVKFSHVFSGNGFAWDNGGDRSRSTWSIHFPGWDHSQRTRHSRRIPLRQLVGRDSSPQSIFLKHFYDTCFWVAPHSWSFLFLLWYLYSTKIILEAVIYLIVRGDRRTRTGNWNFSNCDWIPTCVSNQKSSSFTLSVLCLCLCLHLASKTGNGKISIPETKNNVNFLHLITSSVEWRLERPWWESWKLLVGRWHQLAQMAKKD